MKIRIEKINKSFHLPKGEEFTVLEDIDLAVEEGDFVMILGESGCGKSTLLNILAGLLPPSSGEIWINNTRANGPHPSRSILFQQPSLLPWLNVEDNIMFGCKIRGEKENLKNRVHPLIKKMGLAGFEKIYPPELSVGLAHRVCLARALIGQPEILLLDEPFGALDTFTRTRLQEELIGIWQRKRFTAIFVTHHIEETVLMGNKIVLLGGRPCRVKAVFENTLEYPRDITDDSFFRTRAMIIRRFREIFAENQN